MKRRFVHICVSLWIAAVAWASNDTVYVSGGIQHDGLLEWRNKVAYLSNSYVDFSVHYYNDSNSVGFRSLRATTRAELTQWPLPGYEDDIKGHGIGHLSVEAVFDRVSVTLGDVYAQFGSGLILNIYEDRALGIDGALRGAKIETNPCRGLYITLLGGKQRRYWSCYSDRAWGWNYGRDAVLGADAEIHVEQWSKRMQDANMNLLFGGSYVSKYESFDTIIAPTAGKLMMYNLPRWVGAGDLRAQWQYKGWDILVEYALKANDPTIENDMSYRIGDALFASVSYSRKGLSVLAQIKRSDNMSFRSERTRIGLAGRLNNLPAFGQQHTYTLPALYSYATQYVNGEWAFQAEARYTWPRKSVMGGKYGTTIKLSAAHIRGLRSEGSWAIDTRPEGEYYTDVNIELNKHVTKIFWLNAMLMYQTYNRQVMEGKGGLVRSGIAVVDAKVQVTDQVAMRAELQYLYSPHYQGQWICAFYELSLVKHLTLSGQWLYNIGGTTEATHEHFYTAAATFSYGAHRLCAGYTKTKEGFNCSGGVCRYIPRMEGVCLSYNFTW